MKAILEFKDVSDRADAAERADHLPELQQELERMGFRHLGYLEEYVLDAHSQLGMVFLSRRDSDFVTQALSKGHVTEVMTAPGEIASVELERFFESELLTFRTVLGNGVVVETGIRPLRLPKHQDEVQPVRDILEPKPIQKFLNLMMGGPGWGRHHRPLAGYLCEFMDSPTPREIWMRHKRRVEEIVQQQRVRVPPQNDLRFLFVASVRRQQIHQFWEHLASRGQTVLFGLFFLVLIAFFVLIGGEALKLGIKLSNEVIVVLGFSTFFLALIGLAWPARIAAIIARYLPWPRTQPLKAMLQALPVSETTGQVSLRREFEGGQNAEAISLFNTLQNISHLKAILFKDEKSLLEQWLRQSKRERTRRKLDPQKALRLHQRYERLLCAELKLRGLPKGPKDDWPKLVFKMITSMALGNLLGLILRQISLPAGWRDSTSIIVFISSLIGIVLVDELFGFLFTFTWYAIFVFDQHGVWIGIGLGVTYALFWQFFLQKRKFKKALQTVKEQYDL